MKDLVLDGKLFYEITTHRVISNSLRPELFSQITSVIFVSDKVHPQLRIITDSDRGIGTCGKKQGL